MPPYKLPDLPYAINALEPHISTRTMEMHHGTHHRAYVEGANTAMAQLAEARVVGETEHIAALERDLAFNVSGHIMHALYWKNLRPGWATDPVGPLKHAIERDFESLQNFRKQLIACAGTIHGSGWGMLAFEPDSNRLITVQVHDHQNETVQGATPLLVIDAWEHAYYLQHGPKKADYFDAVWNLLNWEEVAARLDAALSSGTPHRW